MESAGFHRFSELPLELRICIWKQAVQPRIVHVRCEDYAHRRLKRRNPDVPDSCRTPAPGVMQACQESRHHALYKKLFSAAFKEGRYTWVNFDKDIICVGDESYTTSTLEPYRKDIKRLRWHDDCDDYNIDGFWLGQGRHLKVYPALREVHVSITGPIRYWSQNAAELNWGYVEMENVWLIEKSTGLMLNARQLKLADDFLCHWYVDPKWPLSDEEDTEEEERREKAEEYALLLQEAREMD